MHSHPGSGDSHGDELLDIAEKSLGLVSRLATSLLDLTRFPVSPRPETARREADAAIAICMACPVRAQ
jgi:hypothetical protein